MAAEYQHIANYDGVLRYVDSATIPSDGANRDWQIYGQYVADGGVTDPAPPAPDVPPPPPDANMRITEGVKAALGAYDATTPTLSPSQLGSPQPTDPVVEARLVRLETTMRALLDGQMTYIDPSPSPAPVQKRHVRHP
jgi:hypothetical protein